MLSSMFRVPLLAILATIIVACAGGERKKSDDSLRQTLSSVKGEYRWDERTKRYDFSEMAGLEEIVSGRDRDQIVVELVDCLDDTSESQSRLEGEPVALGVICYQALSQTVYYEPLTPEGDIAATWPGHISPKASPEELRAAKEAWTNVVRNKKHRFL